MPAGIIRDYRETIHHVHGIYVGIDIYKNKKDVPALTGCVKDAAGIRDALNADVDTFLSDDKATRSAILGSIGNYMNLRNANEKDNLRGNLLIVSISGHGVLLPETDEFCVVPYDYEKLNALGTTLSTITLINAFSTIARMGGKVLLILDACHAGGINFDISKYGSLLSKGGVACISAASANERALETKDGGVFTHFLIEGLQGAADVNNSGYIYLRDWFDYTYDNVISTVSDQHPLLIGTLPGDTVIKKMAIPTAPADPHNLS